MSLPPAIAAKLALLIPRLATNHDGEVVATARAIARTLASAKLDLHDLAQAIKAAPSAAATPEPVDAPDEDSWIDIARWCVSADDGRLKAHEREFVSDMARRLRRFEPSEKQANWLWSIYCRLQKQRAAA